MPRSVLLTVILVVGVMLGGCGLAETGTAVAAGSASEAEQVRQAKQTEARVQKQLEAAYQQAADQRRAAESATQ
jgi:hypothetical protein